MPSTETLTYAAAAAAGGLALALAYPNFEFTALAWTGLAPVIVETLTAALGRLRRESGLTMLLVEQNSRVALGFCERTIVMDKGRIVYDGASAPLRADPERLAGLIGVE